MKQAFSTRQFRLLLLAGGLVLALALAPGCKREPKTVKVAAAEGEAVALASTVRTSQISQEPQLLDGFYNIEANSWRWTAKQFRVVLRPPIGAAQSGATLVMALTVPQVAIDHAKSLTLSASIEGTPLPPETYTGWPVRVQARRSGFGFEQAGSAHPVLAGQRHAARRRRTARARHHRRLGWAAAEVGVLS